DSNYTELETLPNIDINIKCGNSLISRFPLDADLKPALKKNKIDIETYQKAVETYRHAENKQQKREMEKLMNMIKGNFKTTLQGTDPKKTKLRQLEGELDKLENQLLLFEETKAEQKAREKKIAKLNNEIDKLRIEIEEIESGKIYENAFEWRFEFPEVLDDTGKFIGFDVVIGNPPYGAFLSDAEKEFMKCEYSSYHTRWTDTFNYFIGKSFFIIKDCGYICLIVPNNFLFQNEYEKSRKKVLEISKINWVINLGDNVFDDAEVPTAILLTKKELSLNYYLKYADLRSVHKFSLYLFHLARFTEYSKSDLLNTPSSVFGVNKILELINDRNANNLKLIDEIALEVANGIQPTGDKIFRIHASQANELGLEEAILKNVLVGSNFNRYVIYPNDYKVIYTTKNIDINNYPNCLLYLEKFKDKLSAKRETKKGILPWWCLHWPRYTQLFEEQKIIIRQTADSIIATIDCDSYYTMNNVIILKIKEEYREIFDYKFILAALNSKLINYIYKQLTQEENRAFAEVKPQNIRKLSIINTSAEHKKNIIDIVNQILTTKKSNPNADTTILEQQIDQLVYELYGLTEEEIKIVEGITD
ncbi:MAG: Eco57I restriction-modification methylase domain-containing protein, partial [Planktothrix sp.]|uniref:Eco57I restriction-modification methylase domain-containing protein n=1 Tax=Planktothrix sp. TaxID=3088171 RepID=UPI0038D35892